MQKLEVLSPAGDFECLKAAILFGADAVYLGSSLFTMRAAPENFGGEKLGEAVKYAHERGVKVYLTCNTLPRADEVNELEQFFIDAKNANVDAFIISDIGVLSAAKQYAPEVEVHISTQAGIVNHLTANEFYKMGAKRIVLARELCFDEIIKIRENTPSDLDIEAFVHGAMCVSFSGRCLLSNYIIGRDANRGECAQPCRWGYHLVEEKRPGEFYPVYEDEKGTYILNAKDMCMIEHIDKLAKSGITSLKIEGRAKSAYYVAAVTSAYRAAVDQFNNTKEGEEFVLEQWIADETAKVSHRRYTTGFYFGRPEDSQYYENGGYLREYDVICVVDNYDEATKTVFATQKNRFFANDELEVLAPKTKPYTITIQNLKNELGEDIEKAHHAAMKVTFTCDTKLAPGTILRKQLDKKA